MREFTETDAHDEERFPAMPSERRGPRKTEGGRVFMSNVSEEIWAEGFARRASQRVLQGGGLEGSP